MGENSTILILRNRETGELEADSAKSFYGLMPSDEKYRERMQEVGAWNINHPEDRLVVLWEIVKRYKIPPKEIEDNFFFGGLFIEISRLWVHEFNRCVCGQPIGPEYSVQLWDRGEDGFECTVCR